MDRVLSAIEEGIQVYQGLSDVVEEGSEGVEELLEEGQSFEKPSYALALYWKRFED
jgi:methanogenic corrinoid protein MtbC1